MARTRMSPERRRAQILEAAIGCFSRRGPSASTVEIAAAAGVSEALVFHYFPTRDDLWLAAATHSSSFAARMLQFFESLGEGPVEDELLRISALFSEILVEELAIVALLLGAGLRDEALGAQIRQGHLEAARVLAESLRARGALREGVDAEAAALGFIGGLVLCFMVHHREADWESRARAFASGWARAWCRGAVEVRDGV